MTFEENFIFFTAFFPPHFDCNLYCIFLGRNGNSIIMVLRNLIQIFKELLLLKSHIHVLTARQTNVM